MCWLDVLCFDSIHVFVCAAFLKLSLIMWGGLCVPSFLQLPLGNVSPDKSAHLQLSLKWSTVFSAMTRRKTTLILWIVALVELVLYPGLLEFLRGNSDKTKAGWNTNLSSGVVNTTETIKCSHLNCWCMDNVLIKPFSSNIGNNDFSVPCQKLCVFKSISVPCPVTVSVRATNRWVLLDVCYTSIKIQ